MMIYENLEAINEMNEESPASQYKPKNKKSMRCTENVEVVC